MQFLGAEIREQGVNFAIVLVKPHVIRSQTTANEVRRSFASLFPHMPIILMAKDSRGIPTYQGRPDIVRFLANVDPRRIPWQRYSVA